MISFVLLEKLEVEITEVEYRLRGFTSALVVFGLPFFFMGPINVSALINLSDSVTGTVDCRTDFGGLDLGFARDCIEAKVSLVKCSANGGAEEDEAID